MTSVAYELIFLKAGVQNLESYLFSKDLYWSSGAAHPAGSPPFPQMTVGALLLAGIKIRAFVMTPDDQAQYQRLVGELEALRMSRWVAWEKKASREFSARLKLWRDYLFEYEQNPGEHANRYAYEVTRRVMLDILGKEVGHIERKEQELLNSLDLLLEAVFIKGDFIWEDALVSVFPRHEYWYMWGKLNI